MKSYSDILAALEARKTAAHGTKALPLTRLTCWITTRSGQNTRAGKQLAARSWKNGC